MRHWNEAKIKEFADVKGGKRLPKGKQLIKEQNSHPYIRIRDLGKSKYLQLTSEYEYVDDDTQKSIARYIVNEGDILISVVGTIGLIGIVGDTLDKANQTENCDKIVNIKGIIPEYLYYYLVSDFGQEEIRKGTVGAVQPKLPLKNVQDITVRYPSIEEQEKIVSILSSIDEKIATNETINNNLEQQMQALFNEYAPSNEFDNLTTVENVVLTANTGADAIQKAPIVDYNTGIRCIRVGDMTNSRSFYEWGFTKVTDEIFERYQLHKNDIVVTRTATLGLNTIIPEDLSAVYNNGLIRLTVDTSIMQPLYLYRQFQTEDFKNYIARIESETSVRPNMKINYLLRYEFVLPSIEKQSELVEQLSPMLIQQNNLVNENKKLESLRDTLLPKLMSGELDVSDIEI